MKVYEGLFIIKNILRKDVKILKDQESSVKFKFKDFVQSYWVKDVARFVSKLNRFRR